MAYEIPSFCFTATAGEDLSAEQYKFVKMSDDDTVVACTGATDKPIGVLQNDPGSGQAAEILAVGVSKVEVGTEITAGDTVGTDGNALAEPKTDGTDTTNYGVGICLEGVAANEVGTVFINVTPNRAA